MDLKLVVPANYQEFIFKDYEFISNEVNIITSDKITRDLIEDLEFLCLQPITFLNLIEVQKAIKEIKDGFEPLKRLDTFLLTNPLSESEYTNYFGEDYLYSYNKYVTDLSSNIYNVFLQQGSGIDFHIMLNFTQDVIDLLKARFRPEETILYIKGLPYWFGDSEQVTLSEITAPDVFKTLSLSNNIEHQHTYEIKYDLMPAAKQYLIDNNYDITNILNSVIPLQFMVDSIFNHLSEIKIKYKADIKAVESLYSNHSFQPDAYKVYGLERSDWQTQSVSILPTVEQYEVIISNPDIDSSWVTDKLDVRDTLAIVSDNSVLLRTGITGQTVHFSVSDIVNNNVRSLSIEVVPTFRNIQVEVIENTPLEFYPTLSLGNVIMDYKVAAELTEEEYNSAAMETDPEYSEAITNVIINEDQSKYNAIYMGGLDYQPIFEYITIDEPENFNKLPQEFVNTLVNYTSRGFKNYDNETSTQSYALFLKTIASQGHNKYIARFSYERTKADYTLPKYFKGSMLVNTQDPRYHMAPSVFVDNQTYATQYGNPPFTDLFGLERMSKDIITEDMLIESNSPLTLEEYKALPEDTTKGVYALSVAFESNIEVFSHIFNPVKIEDIFASSFFKEIVYPYNDRAKYKYFESVPTDGLTLNTTDYVLPYVEEFNFDQKIYIKDNSEPLPIL